MRPCSGCTTSQQSIPDQHFAHHRQGRLSFPALPGSSQFNFHKDAHSHWHSDCTQPMFSLASYPPALKHGNPTRKHAAVSKGVQPGQASVCAAPLDSRQLAPNLKIVNKKRTPAQRWCPSVSLTARAWLGSSHARLRGVPRSGWQAGESRRWLPE